MGNPTWNYKRTRCPSSPITHVASGTRVRMWYRRLLTWEVLAVNANKSLTATCAQNLWIILGKYLNVKLTAYIIIRARSSRDPSYFSPWCGPFIFLVEWDKPDEHNEPDTSDQPASCE